MGFKTKIKEISKEYMKKYKSSPDIANAEGGKQINIVINHIDEIKICNSGKSERPYKS
jgi:hypothetical protein